MTDLMVLGLMNLGLALTLMTALWVVSLVKRDASIVDPFWGLGFVAIAWVTFAWSEDRENRSILLVALTTIWGLRLSVHLLIRNRGEGEDYRYRTMRVKHGKRFWWVSWLTVFGLQGVIMWFVAWPIQFGGLGERAHGLGWLDACGVSLWMVGFYFESIGDYQLARFKANPNNLGGVMDRGLWRYTRHPNYFGDFCVWWGMFLVATAGGAWWTIASPLLMSVLLMKVSGVTLLEKTIAYRRPKYADYCRRTNAFFPWLPKRVTKSGPG